MFVSGKLKVVNNLKIRIALVSILATVSTFVGAQSGPAGNPDLVQAAFFKGRLVKYASSGVRSPSAVCGRRPL